MEREIDRPTPKPCGLVVGFGFNLRPRGIQQIFSGSFETLLSISVSIETEMMIAFDGGGGCREPSWLENIEVRAKKAIKRVLPQLLLRRSLQRQHARSEKFWPSPAIHRSFESF